VRAIIWCVLVCFVVTGCTPDQPDSQGPTSSSSRPATQSSGPPSPPPSPPPVTRSLDPRAYGTVDTVCDLLTDDQAAELALPEPSRPEKITNTAMTCSREKPGDKRWLVEYDLWLDFDVLGEMYRKGASYELLSVEGQPAALQYRSIGSTCIVTVGLSAQAAVKVKTFGDPKKDACSLVTSMAEQIVRNLKG
jgi:uncharacterized protein DUF3558